MLRTPEAFYDTHSNFTVGRRRNPMKNHQEALMLLQASCLGALGEGSSMQLPSIVLPYYSTPQY